MSGSRNVEDLTFTYYTGQDGSVQSGPHCHSCMNGLYHDGKLDEVQFAYVPTPNGFIEFRPRTLLFLYGIQSPFTMTSFSEGISPRKCTLCASATDSQDISDLLDKDQSALLQPVTQKRKLNSNCLPIKEENDILLNIEDVSMENIVPKVPRTNKRSKLPSIVLFDISDSEDLEEPGSSNIKPEVSYNMVSQYPTIPIANPSQQMMVPTIDVESTSTVQSDHSAIIFPFIRGRNLKEVLDFMKDHDVLTKVAALRDTVQAHMIPPKAILYFGSMNENTHFYCDHCDFDVWTSCGIAVVHHILSDDHLQKVYNQGLVFSESDDYGRLVDICQELSDAVIKTRTQRRFEIYALNLSDEILTSIASSYFRDIKTIYCHHCDVIFNSGSELIRHYISFNHYLKVVSTGRCFSYDKDLKRFKRIYEDAASESDKDQSALLQLVRRKRKLNTDCLPIKEENDHVNIEDVSMKNIAPKVARTDRTNVMLSALFEDLLHCFRRSQPPTITLSDSEDLDEPRSLNMKPEVAYNIVSQYPTIPIANPSQQTMVNDLKLTPAAQNDYYSINFPFIRGRHVNEVSDSMTRPDVLKKVAALWQTVQSRLIPITKLYFSSMKENTHFHCDQCDFDVWTSCGIAVVHHILSAKHLRKVYTQGLVYSKSDDYARLVNICQELPAAELKKLTKFSWDLSDEVLTSIANSYFRDMKMIYCYFCNVTFKSPLGSELIRHYLSPDHFQKVNNSGRCFSNGKDLERFKRIYRDAAAECRLKR